MNNIEEIPEISPKQQMWQPAQRMPMPQSRNEFSQMPSVTKELSIKPLSENSNIHSLKQPFFVRIDKFNEAKEKVGSINSKLKELEHILRKIEEIKQEEEQELEVWKNEIKEIKDFLLEIDKEIFNKL